MSDLSRASRTENPLQRSVEAWRSGTQRASGEVYNRVRGRLGPWLERLCRTADGCDADDLFQDAFVVFADRLARFDPSGGDMAILGWFRTTLTRRVRRAAVRESRHREAAKTAASEAVDPACSPPSCVGHRLESRERIERLQRLVSDRRGMRMAMRSRSRLRGLLTHMADVIDGEHLPCSTDAELAARFGMSQSQLVRFRHALERGLQDGEVATVADSTPPAAARSPRPAPPASPVEVVSDANEPALVVSKRVVPRPTPGRRVPQEPRPTPTCRRTRAPRRAMRRRHRMWHRSTHGPPSRRSTPAQRCHPDTPLRTGVPECHTGARSPDRLARHFDALCARPP